MSPLMPVSRSTRPDSGFTLVEALAALGIFAMAVLVAAAFLHAHGQAARRLALRSALVHATETTLEEIRSGTRPLESETLELGGELGLATRASLRTRVTIETAGAPDLYRVIVSSQSAEAGEPMAVVVESMVWRP